MNDSYSQLLDGTIQHLEELKRQGQKFVMAERTLLQELKQTPSTQPSPLSVGTSYVKRAASPAEISKPVETVPRFENLKNTPPIQKPEPIVAEQKSAPIPPIAASGPPLTQSEKEEAIAGLRERALVCVKCPNLVATRKSVVFGVGDIHSPLMFVGEAPGADEDIQGEPFVGLAGQLLTRIIQTMGFNRDTVYIANVLKCRPDTPGLGYGNRKPSSDEMKTCLPYLMAQIDLIRPKVIVALGATAMEGLFGRTVYITRERGAWKTFREIPVMPTFHPSYLLHKESISMKDSLLEKRKVWEDMLAVLTQLGRPISEKQKGFFLPAARG